MPATTQSCFFITNPYISVVYSTALSVGVFMWSVNLVATTITLLTSDRDTTTKIFVGGGLLGSIYAVYWTWRGAREAVAAMRPVYAAVCTLAFLYLLSYLFIIFTNVDELKWSYWVRGLVIVAWVVVWAAPARRSIKIANELNKAVMERFKQDD